MCHRWSVVDLLPVRLRATAEIFSQLCDSFTFGDTVFRRSGVPARPATIITSPRREQIELNLESRHGLANNWRNSSYGLGDPFCR